MINYKEEVTKLNSFVPGDQTEFWKPKQGQHNVVALSELEEAKPYINKKTNEQSPQVKLDLLMDSRKFTWTIPKGVSPVSTYGQLCRLAVKKGQLKDAKFMVVVTSDGKKNTYTIVDVAF